MAFKTEFEFTLPKGFVDAQGNLHRKGVMRLATAKDEIIPLQDFRVKNNRAYLVIILLSRVVAYIAYHFHWAMDDILGMEHKERHMWIKEISEINKRINEASKASGG